jgi:hypothetical protein
MTITIADDLAARLKSVSEQVDWSAVASKAFLEHLRSIERAQAARREDLPATARHIRQLSRSITNSPSHDSPGAHFGSRAAGSYAGRKWAEMMATPPELARLSTHVRANGVNWWHENGGQHVHEVFADDESFGEGSSVTFFEALCGDPHPDDEWLEGFVEGAVTSFDKDTP